VYDLQADPALRHDLAAQNPAVCRELFACAREDAGGQFPQWLVEHARSQADAPGCSPLVVRDS